jgi:hypothetical protein
MNAIQRAAQALRDLLALIPPPRLVWAMWCDRHREDRE